VQKRIKTVDEKERKLERKKKKEIVSATVCEDFYCFDLCSPTCHNSFSSFL
jgi:hypothetical protein